MTPEVAGVERTAVDVDANPRVGSCSRRLLTVFFDTIMAAELAAEFSLPLTIIERELGVVRRVRMVARELGVVRLLVKVFEYGLVTFFFVF